jgi:hypothetical protein
VLKHLKQLGSSSDWDAKILFLVLGFAVEAKEGITIKCGEMGDG